MAYPLMNKLIELSAHAASLSLGFLVITAIAVCIALLLHWVEQRWPYPQVRQVLAVLHKASLFLVLVDCLLLAVVGGVSAAQAIAPTNHESRSSTENRP